jgi:hypothetical protein
LKVVGGSVVLITVGAGIYWFGKRRALSHATPGGPAGRTEGL